MPRRMSPACGHTESHVQLSVWYVRVVRLSTREVGCTSLCDVDSHLTTIAPSPTPPRAQPPPAYNRTPTAPITCTRPRALLTSNFLCAQYHLTAAAVHC